MARTLEKELADLGCEAAADEFRDIVADVFCAMYPSWTDEELSCNPSEGVRFCRIVARRVGFPDLPERLVMRTLTNIRRMPDRRERHMDSRRAG